MRRSSINMLAPTLVLLASCGAPGAPEREPEPLSSTEVDAIGDLMATGDCVGLREMYSAAIGVNDTELEIAVTGALASLDC